MGTAILNPAFQNDEIAEVFASYSASIRASLLDLRACIFETAANTEGCGSIEEALRWGQASYLTVAPKSGTTIRLGPHGSGFAMYVHCQTSLIESFRAEFSKRLRYEKNRALIWKEGERPDEEALRACIRAALLYHRR